MCGSRFYAKERGCWWKFGDTCLSFLFEFFFSILASQIKSPQYYTLLLCTAMPLLPLWLLLKHLTTVIVLYINYTPWWLFYYLLFFFFFSKMVLADISSLITRSINSFNTVSGLIWEVGWCCWWWWGWVSEVLWCFTAAPKPRGDSVSIRGARWQSRGWRHLAAEKHLHSAAIRAKAGQKWFVQTRRGNDGLGKGEGCTKSLRGSATAPASSVCAVCECVYVQ